MKIVYFQKERQIIAMEMGEFESSLSTPASD